LSGRRSGARAHTFVELPSRSLQIKGGPFCPYKGTQLGDAVTFIKTHKVALITLAKSVNGALVTAFKAKSVKVADVATAFKTDTPFTTTGTLRGKTEPLAVVDICTYTWECTSPPRGPNIHATTLGCKTIAGVFAAKL
jgi:hypothetical protein